MPAQRQGFQNLLNRAISFVSGEVKETREGVRSATAIKKMLPFIIGVGVVLIVVTLGRK